MNKKDFLEFVETFLAQSLMRPSTLGVLAIKDPMFVSLLRKGRECREATQTRVLDFINNYQQEKNDDQKNDETS